jgi:DUF218 domain-containing protein
MKSIVFTLFFGLSAITCFGQKTLPDPKYKLISGNNFVASKNYYLLTLFSQVPAVKKMLLTDQVLSKTGRDKMLRINEAVKSCNTDIGCYIRSVQFTEAEIKQVSTRLGELYQQNNELGKLVSNHLIPSGCYQLYAGTDHRDMLIKAWEQDAKAVNHTIGVYGGGQKPNYPLIDSISFNVRDKSYPEIVALNATISLSEAKKEALFFTASKLFALHSLEINERNQAADEEPMITSPAKVMPDYARQVKRSKYESSAPLTVNKAALDYAKKIKWSAYKYTLILVPGEGPEERDVALSAGGMLRCRLAALQYRKGLAPFIMVSGGCVHPYKTKYNEAMEMKKFLMQVLHIPECAILVEPHARHTTTNMRNCARLIFRYGFPMDKPCITTTGKPQSYYITEIVPERAKKELGYSPYRNGKRLSDTEAEFYPLAVSLQIDFDEPMDP